MTTNPPTPQPITDPLPEGWEWKSNHPGWFCAVANFPYGGSIDVAGWSEAPACTSHKLDNPGNLAQLAYALARFAEAPAIAAMIDKATGAKG